jgi:WD40 repeat protein/serine/threonine protein kinase
MKMSKEEKDVKAIFSEALEKQTTEERAAYLDKACGNDTRLRGRIEALLKAHKQAGSFLEVPAINSGVTLDNSPSIEGPGTKIGHYELLELIGEGGMGLVYLAQQKEPVKRNVALKIIKPGMDSKQVIARFEAEKQALALLDHPNIAHVFDAGTTETGRPYFVMEYVRGTSIIKYCDERKLNIEQRLRLFEQVCEGIHHAHQKGIIHRDIKPSNILISIHGDKAVPKIIDFGIAKAITQPLTDKTFVTFQGQLLGTPEYMSPEQVDLATQDIDTRSDIYALGVVLYELLAGVLPFERESLARLGFAEVQRTIRELEPASPSMRLTSLGDRAKTIAASRGTQVVPLARRLHRELEWIPLKAMRKDRCRRYRSASEMADDIRNYLSGLPLIAGPETAIYRIQKFVHKHSGSVATVALVAAAIILGLVISTTMYFRAEDARQKEVVARAKAEQAEQATKQKAEELRHSLYVNSIQLADAKHREGNARQVRSLLDSCPGDLRGWEWNRLNYISDQSVMTLRGQSGIGFFAVTFSTDSKYIVAGGWDQAITVWDATSGKVLRTLCGHEDVVYSLAISSDSQRIVSGSGDKTIRIWDLATGDNVKTIRGNKGRVQSVALSPDGKLIASSDFFGKDVVRVWNAETGTELMTLGGSGGHIRQVTFDPDGGCIISSHDSGEMKFWDAVTGKEVMTVLADRGFPSLMAFSQGVKKFASVAVNWDPAIKIWDSESGKLIMTIHGQHARAISIAFSPDGRYIANANMDNTIKVWNAETGEEIRTIRGHDWLTYSVSFSPDSQRLVSCSWDGTVKLWDLTMDRERFDLQGRIDENLLNEESDFPPGYGHVVTSLAFSPDSRRVASASHDRTIRLWDLKTGTEIMTFPRQGTCVVFGPDGKRIAVCGQGRSFKIFDAETGTEVMALSGHKGLVETVAFSPDGKLVASGCREDKTIKVWNAISGEELMSLARSGSSVISIAFSPDNKHIVSGSYEGEVNLWDLSSDVKPMILGGDAPPITSVAFSPDGKRFASGSYDRTIKIWDATNGSEIVILRGHGDFVTSVTFMPDGKRIVSGCRDGTVKIWDSGTGTELLNIDAQRGIHSVALSPDGKTIAAGMDDGSIFLWESGKPDGGYGPRREGTAAKKLMDSLYRRHGSYHDAISNIESDKMFNEGVHKIALQIANSRKWEDAYKLRKEAQETVSLPDKTIDEYQVALQKAEKANDWEPNQPAILNTLGAAQYRLDFYEDALRTLAKSEQILSDANEESDPVNMAFKAMTLQRIGRSEEAKTALDQLRQLYQNEEYLEYLVTDMEIQNLLAEAEQLIAGEEIPQKKEP